MWTFPKVNTVSLGLVFHEVYEKKISKKKLLKFPDFFHDSDSNFGQFSPNRIKLIAESAHVEILVHNEHLSTPWKILSMWTFPKVNTVSLGLVFHEVYETKNPEKNIAQISDEFPRY